MAAAWRRGNQSIVGKKKKSQLVKTAALFCLVVFICFPVQTWCRVVVRIQIFDFNDES